jgi:electron transport complex protein RnfB
MNSEIAPDLVARIDALLPQTQCTRCGYAGCGPYAAAIASGEAGINQCPPGGSRTIAALAALLDRPVQALNPQNGVEKPALVAWIDESRCIGAAKHMHTVLIERCTGCELCLPPCPVDCIELKAAAEPAANQPALNRIRFDAHGARLLNRATERQRELDAKKAGASRQEHRRPAEP